MTTIIEKIDATGLKVRMNNDITVVYLYSDDEGEFFMNENLEKQYVKDTPLDAPKVVDRVDSDEEYYEWCYDRSTTDEEDGSLKPYEFEVEYEHKGRSDGFALTVTKVMARSYEEALKKVYKNFKNIYEIAEFR